jgi:hypothetical protein
LFKNVLPKLNNVISNSGKPEVKVKKEKSADLYISVPTNFNTKYEYCSFGKGRILNQMENTQKGFLWKRGQSHKANLPRVEMLLISVWNSAELTEGEVTTVGRKELLLHEVQEVEPPFDEDM